MKNVYTRIFLSENFGKLGLNPSVMCTSKSDKEYLLFFLFLKVWQGEKWKRGIIIPRI